LQGSVVKIANKAYIAEDLKIKRPYQDSIEKVFQATLETVDFGQPAATADKINRFVRNRTDGQIETVVNADAINSEAQLYLVNAVYFKARCRFHESVSA
jgi:serine protease inhibitor